MTAFRIGDAMVTRIEDSYEPNFDAKRFFPDLRPEVIDEHRAWLLPDHFDEAKYMLKLSMHSWLVRTPKRTILIDTCVGNHKPRAARPQWNMMNTPYLDRLAAAGVGPEQIDVVMCTHLHLDHVGWNTQLKDGRWVPTFPNARYVFSKTEYEHFQAVDRDPAAGPANHGSFRDSVLPVVESRQAEMVSGSHALDDHFLIEPAPGHTPGHVAIKFASQGARAMFSGDILHHALQVYHPDWNSFVCWDGAQARASRKMVLEHCAGTGALLMPAHFGAPFVCHIDGKGGRFTPRFGAA